MENGFFCDTGAIIGFSDARDHHYKPCKSFFKKYPLEVNEYYITKIVEEELKNKKRKFIADFRNYPKNKKLHIYLRRAQQYIDICLKSMESFNCEEFYEEDMINNLILGIQPIIGSKAINQVNDTKIIANAVIWSLIKDYKLKRFLTVDKKDLSSNESKIFEECEKRLEKPIPLKMVYLPDYSK